MRKTEQSIKQRITNLKKLIGNTRGFKPLVVFGYKEQLRALEQEQTADKNKRIAYKKNNGN